LHFLSQYRNSILRQTCGNLTINRKIFCKLGPRYACTHTRTDRRTAWRHNLRCPDLEKLYSDVDILSNLLNVQMGWCLLNSAAVSRYTVGISSRHASTPGPAVVVAVVFTLDHFVTTQTTMGWTESLLDPRFSRHAPGTVVTLGLLPAYLLGTHGSLWMAVPCTERQSIRSRHVRHASTTTCLPVLSPLLVLSRGQVRYCSLTSLNVTQTISDNHCRVYYETNWRNIFIWLLLFTLFITFYDNFTVIIIILIIGSLD